MKITINYIKCHNNCSVRVTISCRMVFDDYPLDDHSCQFQVGSCKFSMKIKNGVTSNISCFVDYDTIETVTCRSFYIYDQVIKTSKIKSQSIWT